MEGAIQSQVQVHLSCPQKYNISGVLIISVFTCGRKVMRPKKPAQEQTFPQKNGKRGVLGRICWCVACYDCLLMFNVFSLLLMFYVWGVLGEIWC